MKLEFSVEVVRHGVDLKARVALKTDRSVFKAVFKARSKKQEAISKSKSAKANTEIASRPQNKKQ